MPFKPGQSGNPSGPKKKDPNFLAALRKYESEALAVVVDVMRTAKDPNDRLKASTFIIERLHGKPAQSMELTGKDGAPMQAVINFVARADK